MNRRGFFGRVTGLVVGAVAASAGETARAVESPAPSGGLTERDVLPGSLTILHYSDSPKVCEFRTKRLPALATDVTIRMPEYGVVFSGVVTQTRVRFDSDEIHVHAQDRWGTPWDAPFRASSSAEGVR